MTDRELLELASKAAGYVLKFGEVYIVGDTEVDCTDMPFVVSGLPDEADWHWNPLTDDGDAFRLAVKLNLQIHRSYLNDARLPVVACHKMYEAVHEEDRWQWIFVEDDSYTATRRAIVRAAAEIGKTL